MASPTISGFRAGNVIGRGVSVYFRNFVAFVLATIMIFAVPFLLSIFVIADLGPGPAGILLILVWLIACYWLSAVLVGGVASDFKGSKASVGQMLRGIMPALVPVTGAAVLVSLMVTFGLFAFLVPGVILCVVFWVAVPVAAFERTSVSDSMKRSLQLTKGHRWQVFFVMVLWLLVSIVLLRVVGFAVGVPFDAENETVAEANAWTDGRLVMQAISVPLFGIAASILAVGYHDLRFVKESIGDEEIARTFD